MGVEPLEAGEGLSAHVAVDQHAASLPGDELVHLGGRQRDKAGVCGAAVPVSALQRGGPGGPGGPGGAGGHQGGQKQKNGSGGQVHFHKRMDGWRVRARLQMSSRLLGFQLSADSVRQLGFKHPTETNKSHKLNQNSEKQKKKSIHDCCFTVAAKFQIGSSYF